MTAKKITKATKSSTPATKTTKAAAKSAKKTAEATSAIVAAVARAAAPAIIEAPSAPAIKPLATTVVHTTITARIDVGFGNALYLRGEGPGLSWDQGVLMNNIGSDLWQIQLGEAARPFVFKFLVNDIVWSTGPDYTISAGTSATFTPQL